MTGTIEQNWYDESRHVISHYELEHLFSKYYGEKCTINDELTVFGNSSYLSQHEIDSICDKLSIELNF